MFNPNNLFTAILIIPILNILIGLYKFFLILKIPGALGFSLMFLTVVIRLILYPLTTSQLKNAHKLNKLKPQLDKLSEKYKNDKTKLHQEQLKLYKEAGINPVAGCLPLFLQMPILIALYNLFFRILSGGNMAQVVDEINKVVYFSFLKISSLDLSFLGFNLANKPAEWQKHGVWLLLIPIVTFLLQRWQTKMLAMKSSYVPSKATSSPVKKKTPDKKEKEEEEEDIGAAMQKQMSIMMPIMVGFFAYSFPLGLSLYWNTFTLFGIIQQYKLNRQLEKKNGKSKTGRQH